MKKILLALSLLLSVSSLIFSQQVFKGMVEYSYQLKGEGSEMMALMMPEKMVVKYGDNRMMTFMKGGMMADMMGTVVVNGETGENFVRKDNEQAVYFIPEEEIEKQASRSQKPQVEKMEEEKEIMGYRARKYKLTSIEDGKEFTQYIWTTDELAVPEIKNAGLNQMGGVMSSSAVPGFPLLVESSIPQTNVTLLLEVQKIEKGKVADSEFVRPTDYELKPFSEMTGQN